MVFIICLPCVQFCYSSQHWTSFCIYPLAWDEFSPEGCRRHCQRPTLTHHTYHVRLLNALCTHGSLPSSAYEGQGGSAWKLMPLMGNSHPWLTGTGGPVPHVPQNHSAAGSQHLRVPQPDSFSVRDGNDNVPSVFPPCFTPPSAAKAFPGFTSRINHLHLNPCLGVSFWESPCLDRSVPTWVCGSLLRQPQETLQHDIAQWGQVPGTVSTLAFKWESDRIGCGFQLGHLVAARKVDWRGWDWSQGDREEAAPERHTVVRTVAGELEERGRIRKVI